MVGLILLGFANSMLAIDKAELDNQIRRLTAKLEAMQQKLDKSIPAGNLRKAQGIILLDRTKAGFIFAYQGGANAPDDEASRVYYEQSVSLKNILFENKVKSTEAVSALASKLLDFATASAYLR